MFGEYGRITKIRVPKKPNSEHRGFCFVEFSSVEEAVHAKESLSHTHLYGRKFVIEFAASAALDDLKPKKAKE